MKDKIRISDLLRSNEPHLPSTRSLTLQGQNFLGVFEPHSITSPTEFNRQLINDDDLSVQKIVNFLNMDPTNKVVQGMEMGYGLTPKMTKFFKSFFNLPKEEGMKMMAELLDSTSDSAVAYLFISQSTFFTIRDLVGNNRITPVVENSPFNNTITKLGKYMDIWRDLKTPVEVKVNKAIDVISDNMLRDIRFAAQLAKQTDDKTFISLRRGTGHLSLIYPLEFFIPNITKDISQGPFQLETTPVSALFLNSMWDETFWSELMKGLTIPKALSDSLLNLKPKCKSILNSAESQRKIAAFIQSTLDQDPKVKNKVQVNLSKRN